MSPPGFLLGVSPFRFAAMAALAVRIAPAALTGAGFGGFPGINFSNMYARYFIGFAVFEYLFTRVSELLNLSALEAPLPEEFKGTFDQEAYDKSQKYTRAKTVFKTISDSYAFVQFFAFWYTGLFNVLDVYIRSNVPAPVGYEEIVFGVSFIMAQTVIGMVLELPIGLYSAFVLEEKFGFNKMTLATFIKDQVVGLALSSVLIPIVLSALIYFFEFTGENAWVYCWGFASMFTLFMQWISPTVIMPLFNKFEPLKDGELKDRLTVLAKKEKFDFSGVFIMDGSLRSSHSNAFFAGFGRNKRICLFDTLIEKQSVDEIVAILGHEIGHYQMNHILYTMVSMIAQSGIIFRLMQTVLSNSDVFNAFNMTHHSVYVGLMLFSSVYAPVSMVTGIVMKMYSRRNEYEADRYSIDCCQMPDELISGLKGLSRNSYSNLTPHPFYEFINYSHPSMLKRIDAIRAYAKVSVKKDH